MKSTGNNINQCCYHSDQLQTCFFEGVLPSSCLGVCLQVLGFSSFNEWLESDLKDLPGVLGQTLESCVPAQQGTSSASTSWLHFTLRTEVLGDSSTGPDKREGSGRLVVIWILRSNIDFHHMPVVSSALGQKKRNFLLFIWLIFRIILCFCSLFIYDCAGAFLWLLWMGHVLQGAQGSETAARGLSSWDSWALVVVHRLSCSAACGVFPDQGWNPCLLHRRVGSLPLSHQGNPSVLL